MSRLSNPNLKNTVTEDNLARSIEQVFQKKYVIPLYQRNYNWGVEEIETLLQDVYRAYKNERSANYFIGSLVVFERNNGQLEIIDGQQRLTTITLIGTLLNIIGFAPNLTYDSRPEVERYLKTFFETRQAVNDFDHVNVQGFNRAIDIILTCNLDEDNDSLLCIKTMDPLAKTSFAQFFYRHVLLIFVKVPADTDVASYFEIMNNRGKQLQEHEILKARLMSRLQNPHEQHIFGRVWDACSQIDAPVHKSFNKGELSILFGEGYDSFIPEGIAKLAKEKKGSSTSSRSIVEVLFDQNKNFNGIKFNNIEHEDGLDNTLDDYSAVVDFPTFLIHVLKLVFKDHQVPLSSDNLLKIYDDIPIQMSDNITPMLFIGKLLFYRVVFDRFTIKSAKGMVDFPSFDDDIVAGAKEKLEDRWLLKRPVKRDKKRKSGNGSLEVLRTVNTFEEHQDRIVKCLSMLQVTYRQKRNKNYLQLILSLFDPENPDSLKLNAQTFLSNLDAFIVDQYNNIEAKAFEVEGPNHFMAGTQTPFLVFNFIDYLYWVERHYHNISHKIDSNFNFTYRNSIEHHFPQVKNSDLQIIDGIDTAPLLHALGNLCLVSKSANSRLSDRSAYEKATDHRYSSGILPPKRKIMYELTRTVKEWNVEQIQQHHDDVLALLGRRCEILDLKIS